MSIRPTIDDIAQAAQVSKGTVSRVINGHSAVAPMTRERVQEAMRRMGYSPDPRARHLSWSRGQTLGLMLDAQDLQLHPYFILFQRALDSEVGRQGIRLEIWRGDLRHAALPSAALVLHARERDERLAFLAAAGVPTVLIGHHAQTFWVAPADEDGGRLAAQHLLGLGHRSLAYLGHGPSQVAQDRERGFVQAVRAAGAQVQVIPAAFGALDGYRAMRRVCEQRLTFTALFAQSDESAVGAVAALEDAGYAVPSQVSVLGFDGLPELPLPLRLTTIAQDIPAVAHTSLQLVQEALAGQPARGTFIPVHLLPGATTAPPPGGLP